MDRFEFDSILFPLSFTAWIKGKLGPSVYKRAKTAGTGILALKAMMHGNWPEDMKKNERPWEKAWYEPFDEIDKAALGLNGSVHGDVHFGMLRLGGTGSASVRGRLVGPGKVLEKARPHWQSQCHPAALARKQPTPLARGSNEVWACGIVRTIGWANVLDDRSHEPYMKLIDIDPEFGVAASTGQGKSLAIRRMFGIGRLDPDWTVPSRLGDNPLVWKVWVHGLLVDMRDAPRKQQEAAFRKGLIPYIPADREENVNQQANKPQDKPDLAVFEADLFGAMFGFYGKTITLLRKSSLDEEKKKLVVERIGQLMQSVTEEMERSRDWHVAGRLESAYEEVKRLVDELANLHGSGHSGTSPGQEADASG